MDLILRGGWVIDGTGKPRQRADVGLMGDRIAAVGDLSAANAGRVLDVTNRVVAPGFIDLHTHSDGWLLRESNLFAKTGQGFTTEVLMADGISYAPVRPSNAAEWLFYLRSLNGLRQDDYTGWQTLTDYRQRLHQRTAQNSVLQIPYANLRVNACGWGREPPDDFQLREIRGEIAREMELGAIGLSTGLDYIAQNCATTAELIAACRAMAPWQGLYVTHIRYKSGLLKALREAVEIARTAEVPLHISHLKAHGGASTEQVFELLESARREVDLSFDVYPYQPGSTMLNFLLPYVCWARGPLAALERLNDRDIRARLAAGLELYELDLDHIHIAWTPSRDNARHQGKSLAQYVAETGLPPADALCNLLIEERLSVLLVFNQGDDRLVHPFLQHDLYLMGSDGIYFPDGVVHPRVTGSATRLLGPCVRDHRLFSLEEAVRKLSGGPARRFRLADRGEIRPGAFADLVVFDPQTVGDRATYTEPHAQGTGIAEVLVNGEWVVRGGEAVDFGRGRAPGRALTSVHPPRR